MSCLRLVKSSARATLLLFCLAGANNLAAADDLPRYYGQVPWASVHRDSRNSDFSPLPTSADLKESISVLDGAALINPGVIDEDGNHFVTSARGPGFSHLHAFDRTGRLLWESPKHRLADDLDSHAGFNSPVIDENGDIYIGDGNQLWAFHPDGKLKWVTPLPEPGDPFVYQVISRQGYVGGITTNGKVLFYKRDTGTLAVPMFNLPTGVAPHKGPSLPGLWQGGLMDVTVIPLFKQIAFGYRVQVANAPAVHPETGRIFITAAGPKRGDEYTGILYGLDLTESGVTTAIELPMGGGSGTSPALSVSGDTVYSADGDGNMLAVDSYSGEVRWSAKGEGLLSPAIGPDDTIYTGNIFAAPTVIALNPDNGSIKWARSYDDAAARVLPVLEPFAPLVPDGRPIARLVSVISVSANHVWVGMNFGYNYHQPDTGLTLPIPHKSVVCALDPVNGELLKCTEVRDTVEGMIKIGYGGEITVSHTTIFGSFFYYGVNPSLPPDYRNPVKPVGGMTILQARPPCR
ncbi:MAG: PQQ-binding-like beta-propeller repeat protein [Gammaproteobacteria bacterium]|nr:PQQ-binding-like beta-propeller repeat protein [Gammaproteobacteria bacterium]